MHEYNLSLTIHVYFAEAFPATLHSCLLSTDWELSCTSDGPGQYIEVIQAYGGYSYNWNAESCTDIDYEHCTRHLESVLVDCNARTNCTVDREIVTQMDLQEPVHCPGPVNFIHIEYRCVPGRKVYTHVTQLKFKGKIFDMIRHSRCMNCLPVQTRLFIVTF